MKRFALGAAVLMFSGVAFAQDTTTIKRTETPFGEKTTITKESDDDIVTRRSTTTTGSIGCDQKTVTKTNDFGDTKTKSVTRC